MVPSARRPNALPFTKKSADGWPGVTSYRCLNRNGFEADAEATAMGMARTGAIVDRIPSVSEVGVGPGEIGVDVGERTQPAAVMASSIGARKRPLLSGETPGVGTRTNATDELMRLTSPRRAERASAPHANI